MKRSNRSKPFSNGHYAQANYNRERETNDHDRYPSSDDRQHRDDAWRRNKEQNIRPTESSFYGNVSQREGNLYEKEAGYRERFRKIGEGYQKQNQAEAWPNYSGQHGGKGSKSYRRNDSRILEDICDRLADDPALDATGIEVKVENAEVILTGSVDTRQAKRIAEDICDHTRGVTQVENRLRIQPSIGNGISIGNA